MPWPKDHKMRSRDRILESATTLFSSRGFNNVSIGEVMKNADLTHVSFYSHFTSKQELYSEAFKFAAQKSATEKLPRNIDNKVDILEKLLETYLDFKHVKQDVTPCPLTFLITDVANEEGEVRKTYTQSYQRLIHFLENELSKKVILPEEKALTLSAIMIGGVAIARALDDNGTSKSLLEACKSLGKELIRKRC